MKIVLAIIALLSILSVCNAYTRFTYHNGDEILRQLQLKDDLTYVLFFFDAPGSNRDLRTTNDYYKDRLRAEILEPDQENPTDFVYAEVDSTDVYGNGYLVDRIGLDRSVLKEKPVIVVMKNGVGNLIYGPTAMNSVTTSLEKIANPDQ
mmetsp:Transcript_7454/g.8449  ORF Transcript_7454/g.8449 Transcript_7454/m.8449 type:complete len:149 (+) Transcript_7454:29-475(+)|eukprot:CAMPEP_0205803564 /NCGR_PEP_ID=MMETSP0205-20121125/6256_1 /ASSEMBLY_ACC=CAM_ASM_000278 /TAXON_ID=36767 /ORGANISM="Euplotes focardii, Strain TN1" /LENGTH=148 /DNA_ID=CAMNT_0053071845 /DNA_START=20 /DNA_END=466 /DNA_ORIENTATION=+